MEKISQLLEKEGRSLLCICPLSTNLVEAAADLSQEIALPIVLIASRRQVEAARLGGGYVNHWTTETFAEEVGRIGRGHLLLARDHGGPGQGGADSSLDPDSWMAAAKESFRSDIESGFKLLHIDTSAGLPWLPPTREAKIPLLLELYGFVLDEACARGKKVWLEVGVEDHSGLAPDLPFLRHFLESIREFRLKHGFPAPLFVASPTGSRVEEMHNVGALESGDASARREAARVVREAALLCREFGSYLKEHNADYLPHDSLALRPQLGIRAVNAGPRFGALETRMLLQRMTELGCAAERARFEEIVFASERWRKWLAPGSQASREDCVLLAGHYCYDDPEAKELKALAGRKAAAAGEDLDRQLRAALLRELRAFARSLGTRERE